MKETTYSLEETPPTAEEMLQRWRQYTEKNLPYLVAKIEDKIVGYAYACPYRSRSAYRFTVEESVYVAPTYHGRGIGRQLLYTLIATCKAQGYQQMIAVIAGNDNTASMHFHQKLGFKQVGILEKVGFKFNRWIDTPLMQKELQ